ncbi:O-acetyl-ADP-ribose deacetylase [Rhodococcus sp. NPDC127528]|uniref:O-acetyl-ADP-ribose deacetylase n=1 Tax=unclassified Rhodococcus (in: high G+C Gram-positive bacteria) TaxID=192944 RepID=UPI0036433BF9
MKLNAQQSDRAAGVLLATAAGDALGAGYEFTHPTAETPIEMIGGGPFRWAPGEWTDDTAMAIAVAEVAATGVDLGRDAGLDAVAAQFVRWFDSKPKDIGNQTGAVLAARPADAAAMQARAAALTGRKAGNGSLMRTAPVALAYLDNEKGCLEAAFQIGALTHDDPTAAQACQLWSHAIRHAVLHGTFDGVHGYLKTAPPEVANFWQPLLDQAESGSPADFPKNGWVVHALQTAWWAITTTDSTDARHLQLALEAAVRAGGDTDTTAAIAGGLLGARWGASAVPARWRRILHGWPGHTAPDLVRLAMKTALRGGDDRQGWPSATRIDYSRFGGTTHRTTHPHDAGVLLGGVDAIERGGFDAVVSLCRMGTGQVPVGIEHIEFRLIDNGREDNANLDFVVDDAARTVLALRGEGKRVLLHCVQADSRTPSVAARYSMLLGRNPGRVREAMPWSRPKEELWRAATRPVATSADTRAPLTIRVVHGDITTVHVDAVVNAARSSLLGGGGVDGAIHRAGGPAVLEACETLRATTLPDGLTVGAAVATTAGDLPAQWLIHTVGPRWSRTEDRSDLLRAAYTRSLRLADSLGARTIAFPLISAGSYGWPKQDAVRLAVEAVTTADTDVEIVTLVAYSDDTATLMRRAVP